MPVLQTLMVGANLSATQFFQLYVEMGVVVNSRGNILGNIIDILVGSIALRLVRSGPKCYSVLLTVLLSWLSLWQSNRPIELLVTSSISCTDES